MDRINGGGEKKVGRQGIHTQLTLQSRRSWCSTTCANEFHSASCFQHLCPKLLQISNNSQKMLSANHIQLSQVQLEAEGTFTPGFP